MPLTTLFAAFDLNKSGTLSLLEFRQALRELNLGLTSRDIDKIFARIDSNNDGSVNLKEF